MQQQEDPGTEPPETPAIPLTGPAAIKHALSRMNLEDEERRHRDLISNGPKSKRGKSIQALNALEGLKRNNLTPDKLLIKSVPVVPPAFRPYSVMGDTFVPGDANELYRDLFHYRDIYQQSRDMFGDTGASDAALDLYDTAKALYGYGQPIAPKTKQRGVSGFLKTITSSSPKFCYDDQTEILTQDHGWVLFKDLDPGDQVATVNPVTLRMEFQA